MEPASIRTKNPGAMWGSALAKKWGSTETITLHDGLGQGNNIAVFPTYVQGICAQLDLWRTSANYKNKRFADAIAIWSGHNNVPSYIAYVKARVPGMTENTIMNDEFWRGPMGVAFLKAQAGHEAGKTYPAPDADWLTAQAKVFGTAVLAAPEGLQLGSHGDDVKALQVRLFADGIFGDLTALHVRLWQAKHALPVTGIVDAATKAALGL